MRLSLPPVLHDDAPFVANNDIFGRAGLARGLTKLLEQAEDPQVVVLDAPWGSGKTTFLKMWAAELRQQGTPVIYFDAFENDYADDAFLALAAEVVSAAETANKTRTSTFKRYMKSAARAGTVVATSAAKIGIKAATLGALSAADLEPLTSLSGDIATEVSGTTEQYFSAPYKASVGIKKDHTAISARSS